MNDIASVGRYTILTLQYRNKAEFFGVAFCPICDKSEESTDLGRGQKHALTASILKIRNHMRLKHRVTDKRPAPQELGALA